MVAGTEDVHHLVVGEHAGDRVEAARERLADDRDVRPDSLVLVGEELAGAAEAGLDLVADEQRVALAGQIAQRRQVALARDDHAPLTLDRLDQDGDRLLVDRRGDRVGVAVGQDAKAARERSEALAILIVRGEADDGRGAAVEVLVEDQDLALGVGHALDRLPPLARQLDRGLDRLGAAVHRQEARVAGQLADLAAERAELIVVEGARGERQPPGLPLEGGDQAWVAVPLVDRRVGREAVHVALALDVPDPDALAALEHHVERVVVVRPVALFERDQLRGAAGRRRRALVHREPPRAILRQRLPGPPRAGAPTPAEGVATRALGAPVVSVVVGGIDSRGGSELACAVFPFPRGGNADAPLRP